MSGTNGGMPYNGAQNMGMQNQGQMQRMGQFPLPQSVPATYGTMQQPMNQGATGMPMQQQQQMPQAMPPAVGGGQQPVQMGQPAYQPGMPMRSMRMVGRQY